MGLVSNLLIIIIIVLVVILLLPKLTTLAGIAMGLISNSHSGNYTFPTNLSQNISTNQNTNYSEIVTYELSLINKDRQTFGLTNVTLSPESSAQQHADSMLQYDYFSHWDIYGLKPYMRYTLVGGRGAVSENIAYKTSVTRTCIATLCTNYGSINVTAALEQMEYSLVYNDSICCNNGHRDNILDPNHNQVSIGIAYNSTTVYLVQDFINNYIVWLNNTPNFNNGEVSLKGSSIQNYPLSTIEVSYDPTVTNMTQQQLAQTSDYSYGQPIAGIVSSRLDYYPNLTTIVADNYYTNNNNFLVSFNMSKLINQYGAGEYTIGLWLNNSSNNSFLASTYTIFINSNGNEYTQSNI